jgi:DNA-binding transcriptional MerR regulator
MQVGALARATGLTVRTLHHYDEIGLLTPSGRSESGYRLYSEADIARLHGIQALRQLGLPLAQIGPLLDGTEKAPEHLLEEQLRALDAQIRRAQELREQLVFLLETLRKGETPAAEQWVQSLMLMNTFTRYFSADELHTIFRDFEGIGREFEALQPQVRACMEAGEPPEGARVQALTRQWMALMHRWMQGDFALIERWGEMYQRETAAHGLRGAPPTDMLMFMERAVKYRLALLRAHFGELDPRPAKLPDDAELAAIERAGRKLIAGRKAPTTKAAQALRARWEAELDRMGGGDPALREKHLTLHRADPVLMAGTPLSAQVRDYLLLAPAPPRPGLDPHAT